MGKAVEQGIVNGYPDGTFKPDNSIARGEFVKLLTAAKKYTKDRTSCSSVFNDVVDHRIVQQGWLAPLVAKDIVTKSDADSSGRFNPDNNARREDIAAWAVKSPRLDMSKYQDLPVDFVDKGVISAANMPLVAVAAKLGILRGYPDGTFRADDPATRAEAVAIIFRTLNADVTLLGVGSTGGSGGTGGIPGVPGTDGIIVRDPQGRWWDETAAKRYWKVGDQVTSNFEMLRNIAEIAMTKPAEFLETEFTATLKVAEIKDDGTVLLDLSIENARLNTTWPKVWTGFSVSSQRLTFVEATGSLTTNAPGDGWNRLQVSPCLIASMLLAPVRPSVSTTMREDDEKVDTWLLGGGEKPPTMMPITVKMSGQEEEPWVCGITGATSNVQLFGKTFDGFKTSRTAVYNGSTYLARSGTQEISQDIDGYHVLETWVWKQ